MEAQGVFAVTDMSTTGVSGSSLVIFSVQACAPQVVGVYRITTPRQESGLTGAGNGLLISVKSAQAGSKATDVTARLHGPTLHTEMDFSACSPPHTLPNAVEPVTRMSPGGTFPDTATPRAGVSGSLLKTVIVPDFGPSVDGAMRICTAIELPGPITTGKTSVDASWKSAEDDEMLFTTSGHWPLLCTVSPRSLKSPRQTLPYDPLSAICVSMS